jgi:hypothetical protein
MSSEKIPPDTMVKECEGMAHLLPAQARDQA